MSFGVQGEMVRSGKALAANLAEERTRSGVFSRVPGQLIRPRKGVTTVGPRAGVGSLSCVNPHVSLQVGALGVKFIPVRQIVFEELKNKAAEQSTIRPRKL